MTGAAIAAVAAATLTIAAALTAAGATAYVWFGGYDVSSVAQHTQPVYDLLTKAMERSVKRRARAVEEPLGLASATERGALVYREHCEQCHGGPGVAQGSIGRSMQPLPGPLVDARRALARPRSSTGSPATASR